MGQIVANVGDFNKSSVNGATVYGGKVYFDIPDNSGITGCSVSFVTHGSSGSTLDRGFNINDVRAHSGTEWAKAGSLYTSGLKTGSNSFYVTLKAQSSLSCSWNIGNITLTITYNDKSAVNENTGTMTLDKSAINAGEAVKVSVTAADPNIYRDIYIYYGSDYSIKIATLTAGQSGGATSWDYTIPLSWLNTIAPNKTSAVLRFYMGSYRAGGVDAGTPVNKYLTVNVPATVVPTIGGFTATMVRNGVPTAINSYVQGKSKVTLAATGIAGALGSSISSTKITGGGLDYAGASGTFGPFTQTGTITFTVKVTDTRGRSATRTVTINVLPYSTPAFSSPDAWRSTSAGTKDKRGTYVRMISNVQYAALGGENTVTLQGRYYLKGGTVPGWTNLTAGTQWITGAGGILITRTYIVQMRVADRMEERIVEFVIPTKSTAFSFLPGVLGGAIGKVAETAGVLDVQWPIYSEGKKVLTEKYFGKTWLSNDGTTTNYLWMNTGIGTAGYPRIVITISGTSHGGNNRIPPFTIMNVYITPSDGVTIASMRNFGFDFSQAIAVLRDSMLWLYIGPLPTWSLINVIVEREQETILPASIQLTGAGASSIQGLGPYLNFTKL